MPWESAIESDSLGSISKISGIILAAFWFITVAIPLKVRKPHPFLWMFYLFLIWHGASYFWTIDPGKTLARLMTYVQLFGLMYIIWDLYRTPKAIQKGLQAYIFGAWVSTGGILYNFANNIKYSFTRFSTFNFDVNNLGIILALGIPVAWYLGLKMHQNRSELLFRIVNVFYIPTAFFAIILTASRGAALATLPGIVYILGTLYKQKLKVKFVYLLAFPLITMVFLSFIPQASLDRLGSTRDTITDGDLNGRLPIWAQGFESFAKNPIFGVGSSAFSSSIELNSQAHNTYLAILVDLGIIGFIIFSCILVVLIYNVLNLTNKYRMFWMTMLFTLAIGVFSLNWAHRKQAWIFPILAVANASLGSQQVEKKQSKIRDHTISHNWPPTK